MGGRALAGTWNCLNPQKCLYMSKGNVVLGYGRGAIGDMVLTRLKGQQVAKARNRQPANPRTAPQMRQRAGFIAPLKFYTRGIQNLFQFAFTDKRLKESDYNAFMRINVGSGFPLTPAEFQQQGFPALGNWVMSRGSLVAPKVEMPTAHSNNLGVEYAPVGSPIKIGEISADFIDMHGCQNGDIITFVMIRADGVVTTDTTCEVDEGAEVRWYINQFKVDIRDNRDLIQVMPLVQSFKVGEKSYLGISASSAQINETTVGMACIRSRITSKGMSVSTSRLVGGGYVDDFIDFRNTPAQIQRVLAEWGATSAAILKGGLL